MNNQGMQDRIKSVKSRIEKLIEDGHLDEAKAAIDKFEEKMSGDQDICSMRAVIAILSGNYEQAERILAKGIIKSGNNFDLLYNMGYVNEQKGNYKAAVNYYSRASCVAVGSQREIADNALKGFSDYYEAGLSGEDQFTHSNKNKSIKILHGTMEIANQMYTLSRGLRICGQCADSYNYYPNYLGYKSDYVYDISENKDKEKKVKEIDNIISKALANYDIFHFHFGTSLSPNHLDLPLLSSSGKRVFMHHWGSDVRMYSKAVRLSRYAKVKSVNEDSIKKQLSFLSKYIDDCIVGDYELYEYVKDYYNRVHILPVAMDLTKIDFIGVPDNERLLVVHAPTSLAIKGTEYIINAIEELKLKYDFDFKLVTNMSNECAKAIYKQADIIVDQLLIGCYGVFAIEAMSMGKPVISWISEFMQEKYPKELPIAIANPESIKQRLETLIKDKQMRDEMGLKGRRYVEKYHDMNVVCNKLLNIYRM